MPLDRNQRIKNCGPMVILPPWVDKALHATGSPIKTLTSPSLLSNILSASDVTNYSFLYNRRVLESPSAPAWAREWSKLLIFTPTFWSSAQDADKLDLLLASPTHMDAFWQIQCDGVTKDHALVPYANTSESDIICNKVCPHPQSEVGSYSNLLVKLFFTDLPHTQIPVEILSAAVDDM